MERPGEAFRPASPFVPGGGARYALIGLAVVSILVAVTLSTP